MTVKHVDGQHSLLWINVGGPLQSGCWGPEASLRGGYLLCPLPGVPALTRAPHSRPAPHTVERGARGRAQPALISCVLADCLPHPGPRASLGCVSYAAPE